MNAIKQARSSMNERELLFVLFRDRDVRYWADESGFNKIGVVFGDGVFHVCGRRVVRSSEGVIARKPHRLSLISIPADVEIRSIERFFTDNFGNPNLFAMGTTQLAKRNFKYFDNPVRLPQLECIDELEYAKRWEALLAEARPGDALFTVNTNSVLSKLVAWIDGGVWSHVASYSGVGTVFEAIPKSGVCERPLDVYRNRDFRVGLYRWDVSDVEAASSLDWLRRHLGEGYNYRGALLAGIQRYLGSKRANLTPNDMAAHPRIRLVAYV